MSPWHGLIGLLGLMLLACSAGDASSEAADGGGAVATTSELIVVAAPRADDPYYADVSDQIFAFHLAFAQAVEGRDDFLVLVDDASYPKYVAALGEERVAIAPQEDIWARDFSLSNAVDPVMFRYTAEGQGGGRYGQSEADAVQEQLAALVERAGLDFGESDWLNDGGNLVDDYDGRAVVGRKFLRDNGLSEDRARETLIAALGIDHVAFIEADEQGGLEHADGVVAFIDPNTLVINSYPDDPEYAAQLRADLEQALPGVEIHTIVTPYDGSAIYDERFGSACGLYTNMLVTPDRIYLPQFGIPEDQEALAKVSAWSSKQVVPVLSNQVCHMGGGVRCMSWQLRGENAERLRAWAEGQTR